MTDTNSTPAPLIPLSRTLAERGISVSGDDAQVAFSITEDWLQGRTAFGGLTSAIGVQAMRDLPQLAAAANGTLRAVQTSFVGPLSAGPVIVDAVLLRKGRNVCQAQATIRQQGKVAAVLFGVFADDLDSSMRQTLMQRPDAKSEPAHLPKRQIHAGPQFLRHFDMRWEHGPMPGSAGDGLSSRIHMRMVDGDGLSDEMLTILFADTSPTPATGQFKTRTPASSVSWALELRPLRSSPGSDGWWRADNDSLVVDGGYVNHAARLWAPSGELAALAYQVVAIYG